MKKLLATMFLFNVSCGTSTPEKEATAPTQAPTSAPKVEDPKEPCDIWHATREIIVTFSPVNPVTVDGTAYENSEDFYSVKLDELKKRFGDDVVLDAAVGFSDLTNGNKAYITGTTANSESKTAAFYNDTATVEVACKTVDFIVKTSKRINLKTKDSYKCFNLMAEGLLKSKDIKNYMTLNNFTTNITSYKCSDTKDGKTL